MRFLFLVLLGLLLIPACGNIPNIMDTRPPQKYLILYTNDEHGHIWEKKDNWYKSVAIYEMWKDEAAKCPECIIIKLSGGDQYTGSAISSIFKGESTAEVFHELGYDASAIGNHEFDYGIMPFEKNKKVSGLKYISSNIIGSDMKYPFPPSVILDRGGSKIGVIGVTTEELKQVAFSVYLTNIRVVKAFGAITRELKNLKGRTEVNIALGHMGFESALEWTSALPAAERPVVVFNGHSHDEYIKKVDNTVFIQAKKYLEKYAKVELVRKNGRFEVLNAEIVSVKKTLALKDDESKKIKAVVDRYIDKMERIAGREIIEAIDDFKLSDFQKFYACSVLEEYPGADTAMSNPGAFRDEIRKGPVKMNDIISMLPFENRIVISELKGKDLIYNLNLSENAYCGVERKDDKWMRKGVAIEPEKYYKAVIHEFIYNGGDYYKFIGPEFKNSITAKLWRAPLVHYLDARAEKGKTIEEAYDELLNKYYPAARKGEALSSPY